MLALAGAAIVAVQPVHASLVVTYAEDAGAVNSTLQDTAVINFNALATHGAGAYTNLTWTDSTLGTVGTIDQVYLQSANQYGGANNATVSGKSITPHGYYPVASEPPHGVGGSSAVTPITLTFDTKSAYFGMWWSAGDPGNILTFYQGNTQIAQYTTANLPGLLPKSYFGGSEGCEFKWCQARFIGAFCLPEFLRHGRHRILQGGN